MTITFERFVLNLTTGTNATISGPWAFTLGPDVLSADQPSTVVELGTRAIHDAVTVEVDRAELRPSGLHLYYTINSQQIDEITSVTGTVRLTFEDGTSTALVPMYPMMQTESAVKPGETVSFVSVFPLISNLPQGAVTLEVGEFLVSGAASQSITIKDPLGAWSADPVTVADEQFSVASVKPMYPSGLAVTVDNDESVDTADVLFLGIHGDSIATDENGHAYSPTTAGTGMRRTSAGTMGTGSSTFVFAGLDPSIETLTITSSGSDTLIRGPWSVSFNLR